MVELSNVHPDLTKDAFWDTGVAPITSCFHYDDNEKDATLPHANNRQRLAAAAAGGEEAATTRGSSNNNWRWTTPARAVSRLLGRSTTPGTANKRQYASSARRQSVGHAKKRDVYAGRFDDLLPDASGLAPGSASTKRKSVDPDDTGQC
jgi:hypothetical protein